MGTRQQRIQDYWDAVFELQKRELHVLGDGAIDLRLSTIPNAGLGVFALVPFKRGDLITAYYGEMIDRKEALRRQAARKDTHIRSHIYQKWSIDGLFTEQGEPITDPLVQLQGRGLGSMVNHKEKEDGPNAEFFLLRSLVYDEALQAFVESNAPDRRRPEDALTVLRATRDIEPGEEILVYYGPFYRWDTPSKNDTVIIVSDSDDDSSDDDSDNDESNGNDSEDGNSDSSDGENSANDDSENGLDLTNDTAWITDDSGPPPLERIPEVSDDDEPPPLELIVKKRRVQE